MNALDNINVADFSWYVAGPLLTKTLADYGATVVKVQNAKDPRADVMVTPYKDNKPGINRSGMFAYHNANKYSMGIDLSQPKGINVAKKLIAWSDIVIENFTPGMMEKWGLGYDDIKKIKPSIIMLRLSAQGQTGPLSKQRALGLQLGGITGFVHFIGSPDREPIPMSIAYTDYFQPWFGIAVLGAALDYRRRTGKPQMIDLSQFEVGTQFFAPYLLEYSVNKQEAGRRGNAHTYAIPHGIYPCQGDDCWCAIAVFTDLEWCNFCRVLSNPRWTEELKFGTFISRKQNEDELNRLIAEWTINHTAEEVMHLMQEAGVASGVIKKGEDVFTDQQLRQRDFFWPLNHNEIGSFTHMGQPSILSKTPAQPRLPSPCVGEHTEYVCKHFLGISEGDFDSLLVDGAFGL